MARGTAVETVATPSLTPYEKTQIEAIAAWKCVKPGVSRRLLQKVTGQVSQFIGKALPGDTLSSVMTGINKMAGKLAQDDSIFRDNWLREQGVEHLQALAEKPLEFADELAARIIQEAGRIALGVGAATGTGGPVAALAGMPLLLGSALRVIHRVSQAYGHNGESEEDRQLMLHVLALSTAVDATERARALADYQRQIEASLLRQAISETAQTAVQRALLGAELGSLIPGLGILVNAQLNRSFVEQAGVTAQRVFQERWLRERGKVVWIAPASRSTFRWPSPHGD